VNDFHPDRLRFVCVREPYQSREAASCERSEVRPLSGPSTEQSTLTRRRGLAVYSRGEEIARTSGLMDETALVQSVRNASR